MSVKCVGLNDTVMLQVLPTASVAKVELCSITQLEWDLRSGCESWLMLLHPTSHVATMEASTCAGVEGSEECTTSAPSCWSKLFDKYSDIVEPPGMPSERDIVHRIKLEPGSQPPYQCQYRISAAKLAEVRR